MKVIVTAVFVGLGLVPTSSATPIWSRNNGTSMVYSFDDIQPSPELVWTPCWDNHTCAMLEVPLDYSDPSFGSTSIAFIKSSFSNSSTQEIIINPGGPASSGVAVILEADYLLRDVFGPEYDLVSFDPRGVNNSRASIPLECFPDNFDARYQWGLDHLNVPVDNTSQESLYRTWELARGWGERCKAVQAANGTSKYANTVATATDMLQYVKLRAKSLGRSVDQAKIWYYGASYGTVLGATFTSLFPDRVGRMILDGVVDADQYYEGNWATSLLDSDKAAKSFFTLCQQAGPERCAFHGNASSAEEIEHRFFHLFENIKKKPILVSDPTVSTAPSLVGWQDVLTYFFEALYNSGQNFPILASILNDLDHGNAVPLGAKIGRIDPYPPFSPSFKSYSPEQARTQIACIDMNGRLNISTFEEYVDYVNLMANQSFYGGLLWASAFGSPCGGLDIKPPASQIFNGTVSAKNTSSPILFIGNTLDPVTPLTSAKKMGLQFGGSAVLTVEGIAHTSFNMKNQCVTNYIQGYLADATLPPPAAFCKAEEIPFSSS